MYVVHYCVIVIVYVSNICKIIHTLYMEKVLQKVQYLFSCTCLKQKLYLLSGHGLDTLLLVTPFLFFFCSFHVTHPPQSSKCPSVRTLICEFESRPGRREIFFLFSFLFFFFFNQNYNTLADQAHYPLT